VMHDMGEKDRGRTTKQKFCDTPCILVMCNILFFEVHEGHQHIQRYTLVLLNSLLVLCLDDLKCYLIVKPTTM
jgi:hypothetical protein